MTAHLHTLRPQPGSRRPRNRKGRGIAAGQGASCGFGMRGQKSRSGRPTRPGFEGGQMPLYRRIPKLKHFTVVNPKVFTVVNVGDLSSLPDGSEVILTSLREAGIVGKNSAPLKVLGDGEVKVRLHCKAHGFSKAAREKILAAGGTCHLLPGRNKWVRPDKPSGDHP